MGWETEDYSGPGVNCNKKTEQPLELTLSAIDSWPLIVITWSKLVEADQKMGFPRNTFGQTICTSLTLTECLRCYQHIPSLLVKTGQKVLPNNLWAEEHNL